MSGSDASGLFVYTVQMMGLCSESFITDVDISLFYCKQINRNISFIRAPFTSLSNHKMVKIRLSSLPSPTPHFHDSFDRLGLPSPSLDTVGVRV